MRLFPKRETLTLPNEEGNGETWDYLTIYDDTNNILARGARGLPEDDLYVEYDDLAYIAFTDGRVAVTWDSIVEKFSKPD